MSLVFLQVVVCLASLVCILLYSSSSTETTNKKQSTMRLISATYGIRELFYGS